MTTNTPKHDHRATCCGYDDCIRETMIITELTVQITAMNGVVSASVISVRPKHFGGSERVIRVCANAEKYNIIYTCGKQTRPTLSKRKDSRQRMELTITIGRINEDSM